MSLLQSMIKQTKYNISVPTIYVGQNHMLTIETEIIKNSGFWATLDGERLPDSKNDKIVFN